ncbi:unnamed protein product [Heterobilharzia americana]|nr:unnamed protein product [Heterobilharzia americana]CAH8451655.1 unnamed protein product [Heterobilharzia americana]
MRMSTDVSTSDFMDSGGIPSGTAAFPDFGNFTALSEFLLLHKSPCSGSSAVAGGISGRVAGGGRFKSLLKWSTHCFLCFSSLVTSFPSLSVIGSVCIGLFPESNLVIRYNVVRSPLPAACPAYLTNVS